MHAGLRHLLMSGVPPIADLRFDLNVLQLGGASYNTPSAIPGWTFARASEGRSLDGTLSFASGVPRIVPGLGILVEEARTNLLTYSQEFDNADWTLGGATVSANALAAPDGTVTADKLEETATTGLHRVSQLKTKAASSLTYTFQIFAKAGERSAVRLTIDDAAGAEVAATYDLSAGTISIAASSAGTYSAPSATITPVANGYYRLTLTGTTNTGTSVRTQVQISVAGSISYAGTAGSGIYIWQADLQLGSFATSPIVTTGAAATRAADNVGFSSVPESYNTAEGTWFVEAIRSAGQTATGVILIGSSGAPGIGDRDPTNVSGSLNLTTYTAVAASPLTQGVRQRAAYAFKVGDHAISLNGAIATNSNATAISRPTLLNIGRSTSNTAYFNGYIGRIIMLGARQPNAQIQGWSA